MTRSIYSALENIPSGLNKNLTSPSASFYKQLFGEPRLDKIYSTKPSEATNKDLLNISKTESVGPFRATGLKPAVDSLKQIMYEIAITYPDLVNRLNNDGMRVVKYIKDTTTLSNHSWGGAIDLRVDHVQDKQRDDKILHGLALIAPIFNKHGWYSGAAYKPKKNKKTGKIKSNEDSMHFEVSREKLLEWQKAGLLGIASKNKKVVPPALAVPKPRTSKKKVNKKAENGLTHPHAAETSTWHQKDHYNTKRWNIASRLYSLHRFLWED